LEKLRYEVITATQQPRQTKEYHSHHNQHILTPTSPDINAKMLKFAVGKEGGAHGKTGAMSRVFLRLLQFALALTVAGLYGVDLNNARLAGEVMDPRWIFAVVVAGIAALTCIAYGVLTCVHSYILFAWDWILL
jgi:hypothetical protein